jgi:hypothetical protein
MSAEARNASADPRQGDRRGPNRRKTDRRTPPPPWRRPWALVAYGVAGTLLVVGLMWAAGSDEGGPAVEGPLVTGPADPGPAPAATPAPGAAASDAYGAAGFERLLLRGAAAAGTRVRTEIFCEAPSPVEARTENAEPQVDALAGPDRRIPAAECKWGPSGDARREDFLLLVPPDMAAAFSSAPTTRDDFVQRRRIHAEVEWIGQSPALLDRRAGVLRAVLPPR